MSDPPVKTKRICSDSQRAQLDKARVKAWEVRCANMELRRKAREVKSSSKAEEKQQIETQYDAMQQKKKGYEPPIEEPPVEEAQAEEEPVVEAQAEEEPVVEDEDVEYVYKKPKRKKKIVVVQQSSSSDSDEYEVQLPGRRVRNKYQTEDNGIFERRYNKMFGL
jgi:hypothetical protein